MLTALRQPLRGGVPCGGQPGRGGVEGGPQLDLRGAQAFALSLLVLQPLELRRHRGAERDDRLERVAVLAAQVVEQCQALLGGNARRRVELHGTRCVGGIARQLGGLRAKRGGPVGQCREPIVVLCGDEELALGHRQALRGRLLVTQRGNRT